MAPAIVIAANEGFLAGRVNFAARSHANVDLLQWLKGLPFTPSPGAEYANGHPRATGGSLSIDDFERFMEVLRTRTGVLGGLPGSEVGRPHP
jgi:single-stranded-DNA-specific exonuclease